MISLYRIHFPHPYFYVSHAVSISYCTSKSTFFLAFVLTLRLVTKHKCDGKEVYINEQGMYPSKQWLETLRNTINTIVYYSRISTKRSLNAIHFLKSWYLSTKLYTLSFKGICNGVQDLIHNQSVNNWFAIINQIHLEEKQWKGFSHETYCINEQIVLKKFIWCILM